MADVTLRVVAKTLVVVTAFAEYRLEKAPVFVPTIGPRKVPCAEETLRVVTLISAAVSTVETFRVVIFARGAMILVVSDTKFEIVETLSVVTLIFGITSVSKKNVVFVELAVNDPGTTRFVTFAVVAKTFVVVSAFALYTLEKAPTFAPATGP